MMNNFCIGGLLSSNQVPGGPIRAPQANSYKRVLYCADHSEAPITPSSQPGDIPTISTLTPPEVTQATKAYEIRLTTLEEKFRQQL